VPLVRRIPRYAKAPFCPPSAVSPAPVPPNTALNPDALFRRYRGHQILPRPAPPRLRQLPPPGPVRPISGQFDVNEEVRTRGSKHAVA